MIGDDACHHRLADRHGADADAGIVPALGDDLGLVAVAVDGAARVQDRGGRLHGKARDHRLAGGNPAEDAAGVVRQKPGPAVVAHAHLVGILLAGERGGRKSRADLDALDGIDPHQCRRKIAVELAVDRRAEAGRHAFGDDLDDGADRRAALAHLVEIIGIERGLRGIGTEERIALDLGPVPARAVDGMRSHLHQRAAHDHAGHDLARDRAGGNPRRGLARRLPSAAAIVAQAVFDVVGVVGVRRAVFVPDIGIILRTLVDVVDDQPDRRAGRHLPAGALVGEHAGENAHRVRLLPLRGEARLPGPPLVEIGLDIRLGERNAGRATVDHAADRCPVAFAEGRDPEQVAECIERHGAPRPVS